MKNQSLNQALNKIEKIHVIASGCYLHSTDDELHEAQGVIFEVDNKALFYPAEDYEYIYDEIEEDENGDLYVSKEVFDEIKESLIELGEVNKLCFYNIHGYKIVSVEGDNNLPDSKSKYAVVIWRTHPLHNDSFIEEVLFAKSYEKALEKAKKYMKENGDFGVYAGNVSYKIFTNEEYKEFKNRISECFLHCKECGEYYKGRD